MTDVSTPGTLTLTLVLLLVTVLGSRTWSAFSVPTAAPTPVLLVGAVCWLASALPLSLAPRALTRPDRFDGFPDVGIGIELGLIIGTGLVGCSCD